MGASTSATGALRIALLVLLGFPASAQITYQPLVSGLPQPIGTSGWWCPPPAWTCYVPLGAFQIEVPPQAARLEIRIEKLSGDGWFGVKGYFARQADWSAPSDFYVTSSQPVILTRTDSQTPLRTGTWYLLVRVSFGLELDSISGRLTAWHSDAPDRFDPAWFVPVRPCRLVDTRPGQGTSGAFGPPWMAADSVREIPVPAGACGIPATARAYSLNVTVVPHRPLAFLTLWPSGQPRPFASTLNSWKGTVVANAALVPAGSNGGVSVYVTDPTDLVIDITGYFAPPSTPRAWVFHPVTPCRILDTRPGGGLAGAFGPPLLPAGGARDIPIRNSACAIPPAARAYALNVTAVPAQALGFLTLWPTGQSRPWVSTLNSWEGLIVANAALVAAGTEGAVSVYVTGATDVVLDITGYFAPPGTEGALAFYPITPCRLVDTRIVSGPSDRLLWPSLTKDTARAFPFLAGACALPVWPRAYSLNVTAVPRGPLGFLTLWPADSPRPWVSTLNSTGGSVVANAALVSAGAGGAVSAYASHPTDVVIDLNGYFAP